MFIVHAILNDYSLTKTSCTMKKKYMSMLRKFSSARIHPTYNFKRDAKNASIVLYGTLNFAFKFIYVCPTGAIKCTITYVKCQWLKSLGYAVVAANKFFSNACLHPQLSVINKRKKLQMIDFGILNTKPNVCGMLNGNTRQKFAWSCWNVHPPKKPKIPIKIKEKSNW